MALNPNISLGVRGIELANPLAQYGQIAAIQNAQNQNALAQFQLGSARRQEESQNVLADVYKRSINPETGAIDNQTLLKNLAASNAAYLIPDVQTKLLASEKERGLIKKTNLETEAKEFKLKNDKLNFAWSSVGSAPTPQDAIQKITEGMRNGIFDMKTATADIQKIQNMTPEQYQQYRIQTVMGILDAKDKLGFMLPKTRDRDIGGAIQTIQDNPALPGYSMPIAGMAVTKTPTFGEQNAAATLAFNKYKFEFEKANPTLSIQEDPNGLLAVNTQTGVAFPVVYGPTGFQPAPAARTAPAPAAAPGASIMRQPPAALPGQRVPAIPGMASVLDQTAAPAAAMPVPAEAGARMPGMPVGARKEAPVKFNDTDMQLAGLAGSLKDFKEEINKNLFTGAKYLPSGADTSRMTAKYTALLMGVKDLYTLGALTGPDMSIIESQLTNPASWSGKFKTKEGFNEQVKVIEDMLKRSTTNLETTYGRVPKASRKALEGLPGGAAGGIPGATANDPLGLNIPGGK
jgi:hypothetical protein